MVNFYDEQGKIKGCYTDNPNYDLKIVTLQANCKPYLAFKPSENGSTDHALYLPKRMTLDDAVSLIKRVLPDTDRRERRCC